MIALFFFIITILLAIIFGLKPALIMIGMALFTTIFLETAFYLIDK